MNEYEFDLIIEGDLTEEVTVALYDVGCDDGSFGVSNGVTFGGFDREAETLADAVLSAIEAVESIDGLRVIRVETEPLVTMAEIADRLGRTYESVRLLASGKRGGGSFPLPVVQALSKNRLWRWVDIAEWAGTMKLEAVADARTVDAINLGLESRRAVEEVDPKLIYRIGQALKLQAV